MALHLGEDHLGVTDIFGQDVGPPLGGIFTTTQGLKTAWNTPLDERGIIGTAMGIAYAGGRPVAEIQFCDYVFNSLDLLKIAGNQRWASNGLFDMPIVIMTPSGSGIRGSLYHSHSFDSWATRLPGWKVVVPSNPLDAYGLMLSAIVDPNPVMVLLPKALLRLRGEKLLPGEPADQDLLRDMIDAPVGDRSRWQPRWPDLQPYYVPLGQAAQVREGTDATVIGQGRTLLLCVQAADQLRRDEGLSFDVLDLRSLFPYDWTALSASVRRTGRVLIVNEDTEVGNFGEHLLRRIIEEHFGYLIARPRVLLGKHLPGIGLNPVYENNTVPQLPQILKALHALATSQDRERKTVHEKSDRSLLHPLSSPLDAPNRENTQVQFCLPELGSGVYEVELVNWLVHVGDVVQRGQNLMEVMTDKATTEVPAPFSGTITALAAQPGSQVRIGTVVLEYLPAEQGQRETRSHDDTKTRRQTDTEKEPAPRPSHLRVSATSRLPAGAGARLPFQGLRRKIAQRMVLAKTTIPHYSIIDECEVTELVRLRNSLRDEYAQTGVKLTYLSFFVRAVILALQEVPLVNASLDEQTEEIILHDRYHIGIAVATPDGLIVPVIRDADRLDLGSMAREIERVGDEARAGRARLEDLGNGTFTISSIGGIGGLISTPVLNPPEVGILGIGKVVQRPLVDDAGLVRVADLVYLSLSFDHRVVDGAVGAAFGNAIIRHLQHPTLLFVSRQLPSDTQKGESRLGECMTSIPPAA
jgi:2-oxoisovalerate dehydrogenase E1 component beta subunit